MGAHRLVGVIAVVGLAACGSSTPGSGDSARSSEAAVVSTKPVVPTGFASETVRLTEPDGATCERCLLLARSLEDHRRGLMAVTSLGGYDGMAFVYDPPKRTAFWMKDTVLPLSIRFYDAAGASLADFAMDPCAVEPCPTFGPASEFAVAVEVEQGRLDELGFTATARLELLGTPCDPELRTG